MPLKIEIELSNYEVMLMEDMVKDIQAWFCAGPYKEKIANHEERIEKLMIERLRKERNREIPADKHALIQMYFNDPHYKNRKQRGD